MRDMVMVVSECTQSLQNHYLPPHTITTSHHTQSLPPTTHNHYLHHTQSLPPTTHNHYLPPHTITTSHHTQSLPPTTHNHYLPPHTITTSHHTQSLPPTTHNHYLPPHTITTSHHTQSLHSHIQSLTPHTLSQLALQRTLFSSNSFSLMSTSWCSCSNLALCFSNSAVAGSIRRTAVGFVSACFFNDSSSALYAS